MSEENLPPNVELDAEEFMEDLPVSDDYDPALENIRKGFSLRQFLRDAPSIVFSLVVHAAALLILGICYLPVIVDFRPDLTANIEEIDDIEDIALFEDEPIAIDVENLDAAPIDTSLEAMETEMVIHEEPPKMQIATADILNDIMAPENLVSMSGLKDGSDLGGRSKRGVQATQAGMSEGSERAVGLSLAWIADHQLPNGSWSYTQLKNPNCRGKCKDVALDRGNSSTMSATAMALMPMLGSGITHKDGKYKKNVKAGLDYMTSHVQMKPEGVVFWDVNNYQMYHQGLSTIVICEAAAMTRDKSLEKLAQGAVNYICWAQDPVGGGWRYSPKQPGDTSGMGWNFMALKSAQMAYLNVPVRTVKGSKHFLDNVTGAEGGAKYGYLSNKNDNEGIGRDIRALTAIGLLGQMYMGWKADHPALVKGSDYLAAWGPNTGNLYYSYYATQVMHHVGGDKWDKWNKKLRDDLVKSQVTDGHEKGSWTNNGGGHLEIGGRLTSTAFATMILEVYYRHLPLYRKTSTVEAFPLE